MINLKNLKNLQFVSNFIPQMNLTDRITENKIVSKNTWTPLGLVRPSCSAMAKLSIIHYICQAVTVHFPHFLYTSSSLVVLWCQLFLWWFCSSIFIASCLVIVSKKQSLYLGNCCQVVSWLWENASICWADPTIQFSCQQRESCQHEYPNVSLSHLLTVGEGVYKMRAHWYALTDVANLWSCPYLQSARLWLCRPFIT